MNRVSQDQARALKAFAVTVIIALLMRWEAGDLMWGIWASTTTFGYVYGLVLIVRNPEQLDAGDGTEKGRLFVILTFFTFMFGIFHFGQGMFLNMLFPITSLEGWAIFTYPTNAFSWYWGVIATTFYSRWPQLKRANSPSEVPRQITDLFKNVAQMQVLIFLLMFLTSFGLNRFAVYPILVIYFLPSQILYEKLIWLTDRWEAYLNRVPPDEFEEVDEADDA